jgi:3-mercaptopyruvate sulfurtransferase SseA
LELAKAVTLTALTAGLALAVNAARGKEDGGIPLVARAPYDIYTDCPEMDARIPKLTVKELPTRSPHVIYVDARSASKYLAGHIRGARSMPMYGTHPNAPGGLEFLRGKPGRFVVVYGADEMQSAVHLASWLRQKGIRGVHLLEGDLAAWRQAGKPVQSGQIPKIDPLRAQSLDRALYVDARPKAQYEAGHVPGARSVPFNGLVPPEKKAFARLLQVSKKGGRPVVVYGVEAVDEELADPTNPQEPKDVGRLLAAELEALGAKNVFWLPGGVAAWRQAGGRLRPRSGAAAPPGRAGPASRVAPADTREAAPVDTREAAPVDTREAAPAGAGAAPDPGRRP